VYMNVFLMRMYRFVHIWMCIHASIIVNANAKRCVRACASAHMCIPENQNAVIFSAHVSVCMLTCDGQRACSYVCMHFLVCKCVYFFVCMHACVLPEYNR